MTDLNFVELVHQVIGEFEEKFEERNLTMVVHSMRKKQSSVQMAADSGESSRMFLETHQNMRWKTQEFTSM